MGQFRMYQTFWLIVVAILALALSSLHGAPADEPKSSEDILDFKAPSDDTDPGGEIDELMEGGEGDEAPSDESEKELLRADYDKTLNDFAPLRNDESRYAPSDESYAYFAKRAAHEYTMADVEAYERANDVGTDKRWPSAIVPYELDQEILNNKKQEGQIYAAMQEMEKKTCIDFQPYTAAHANTLGHDQRIKITANQRGCWSRVGRVGTDWEKPQKLNLERNDAQGSGCMHARVVLHELGHALGLRHEQTRVDRDEHLVVYMGNVVANQAHNYKKAPDFSDENPYDFLSIMQYGKDAFGKIHLGKKLITMLPKDSEKCYEDLMGKAKHLSYYDHKLLNSLYECDKDCGFMKCDNDCYATKSGEDKQCHCVCLDNSNNPCKGGTCFQGNKFTNCATIVAENPSNFCSTRREDCCETCKDFKIDPECPIGNKYTNCDQLVTKNPSGFCSTRRDDCCVSCKNVKTDPRCPTGNKFSNCDALIAKHGKERACKQTAGGCCQSCL